MPENAVTVVNNELIALFIMILVFLSWNITKDNDKEALKLKIAILDIILVMMCYFKIEYTLYYLIIYIASTFIFLEIVSAEKYQKRIIRKPFFLFLDYFYKIIFNYGLVSLLLSILSIKISHSFIMIVISIAFLLRNIVSCLTDDFKTLEFNEIYKKIDKVKQFNKMDDNQKLFLFSDMLIYKEDKSFFERANTYNWVSLEFIKYRYKRLNNEHKNIKFIITECINELLKTIKKLYFYFSSKIINKFNPNKEVPKLSGGYSTIEMQLIRSVALIDGYTSHPFRRKIYELVYSTIFFSCLKEEYGYRNSNNYYKKYMYKYYLIYLYIYFAPIKVNGTYYKNILEMYKKNNIYDITYEEFFIWTLALSHRKINDNILEYKTVSWANLNKNKLKNIIKQFN